MHRLAPALVCSRHQTRKLILGNDSGNGSNDGTKRQNEEQRHDLGHGFQGIKIAHTEMHDFPTMLVQQDILGPLSEVLGMLECSCVPYRVQNGNYAT